MAALDSPNVVIVLGVVTATLVGCAEGIDVDGSVGFAVQPVADFRCSIWEKSLSPVRNQATRNLALRIFGRVGGFTGQADAEIGVFPSESTTGSLSFFFARAGLEFGKARGRWEDSARIGLLGYSWQQYDTEVAGLPETYQSGESDDWRQDVLSFGLGYSVTILLTERLALTAEGYWNPHLLWLTEVCAGIEYRMNPRLSILVAYTEYHTDDMSAEDSSGVGVEMTFTSRCLATGVACRF